MNLGQIQTAVDRRCGLAIDSTAQIEFVNQSLGALSAERDWPWLDGKAIFVGDGVTSATALPTTWERTRFVAIGAENEAYPVSIADIDRWAMFEDRPAVYCYAIESGQLVIMDPPPASITVIHRYVQAEPALASSSDTPLLPPRFHGYIVADVARMQVERIGDIKKASSFIADKADWRKRMEDEQNRTSRPHRVRVRDGFGY